MPWCREATSSWTAAFSAPRPPSSPGKGSAEGTACYRTRWLPGRCFTPTFLSCAPARLLVRVNIGHIKQPLVCAFFLFFFFFFNKAPTSSCQSVVRGLQVSAFFLPLIERSGTHITAVSHIISPALLQVFDRSTVSV